MVSTDRRGVHEAVLVRHSLRKPVDGGILVEDGVRDGRITDAGEIVEAEPPRRLVIRWQHQNKPELKAEGESQCTMELEPSGTAVKLSITHTIEREPSKFIAAVSGAWPKVISNLKSLLETGSTRSGSRTPIPLRAPILERSNHGKGHFWKSFVGS